MLSYIYIFHRATSKKQLICNTTSEPNSHYAGLVLDIYPFARTAVQILVVITAQYNHQHANVIFTREYDIFDKFYVSSERHT